MSLTIDIALTFQMSCSVRRRSTKESARSWTPHSPSSLVSKHLPAKTGGRDRSHPDSLVTQYIKNKTSHTSNLDYDYNVIYIYIHGINIPVNVPVLLLALYINTVGVILHVLIILFHRISYPRPTLPCCACSLK